MVESVFELGGETGLQMKAILSHIDKDYESTQAFYKWGRNPDLVLITNKSPFHL